MPFSDFYGNPGAISRVRHMLARDRFPHAVILAGPRGAGKFMLAQMLAKAMNCTGANGVAPLDAAGVPDFCGRCPNCLRIAEGDDLGRRVAEAVEARDGLRETEKRETRIFIQTHPDVLIVPPDPPQMMIKVDQVRHVIASIYFRPAEARRRVFIFTDSAFMKEAANALLKVLEEPPEFATLFLLTENPGELLPTIRSRSSLIELAPLGAEQIEVLLARRRPELKNEQRRLIARLSQGAAGRALGFNIEAYLEARRDAMVLLGLTAGAAADHSTLFKTTEQFRAGAEGRARMEETIAAAYGLLEDLLLITSGLPQSIRNIDVAANLAAHFQGSPQSASLEWIERASDGLAELERGGRRNLLRSLALDSFATALERA